MIYKIELIGHISDIQDREDLTLVTDSQDTQHLRDSLGIDNREAKAMSFFVKVEDGEYAEVLGFYGSIPNLEKRLFRLTKR